MPCFAEQPAPLQKMPLEIITKEDGKDGILDPKDGIEYEVFTSNKSVSGYAGVAKVPKKDGDKADKADKWRATYKDKTVGTFDTMIEAILAHSKVATAARDAQKESDEKIKKVKEGLQAEKDAEKSHAAAAAKIKKEAEKLQKMKEQTLVARLTKKKVKLEAELAAVMTELAAAELAEAAELAAVTTDLAAAKLTEAADVSDA
jgi:hypothetical protein